jgi:hypothetical protein
MNRFERLATLATAVGIGVGVVIASASRAMLTRHQIPSAYVTAIDALVITVASLAVRLLTEEVALNWRFVRKLLLRRQFVEGTWIDVVQRDGAPSVIGIVRFEPSGSFISYSGENLDVRTGAYLGHFSTEMVANAWPRIRFKYTAFDHASSSDPFVQGFGELQFLGEMRYPDRYVGYCIDSLRGQRHLIEGRRITDTATICALTSPHQRAATAVKLASAFSTAKDPGLA